MSEPGTFAASTLGAPAVATRRKTRVGTGMLLRRLLQAFVVAAFVVVVTFLLVRLVPGDPVASITGPTASPATREAISAELHLEDSLPAQFTSYVSDLVHGDLGNSVVQR